MKQKVMSKRRGYPKVFHGEENRKYGRKEGNISNRRFLKVYETESKFKKRGDK